MVPRLLLLLTSLSIFHAAAEPRLHEFKARASELDRRTRSHPEIGFLLEDVQGKALPSATPENRYFGFSHVLDSGWTDDHYCRSWQLLGLAEFGPLIDVDGTSASYGHSRRLITSFDVNGDAGRAHNAVIPKQGSLKTSDGGYAHEPVWRYLFTSPLDESGEPAAPVPDRRIDHRAAKN